MKKFSQTGKGGYTRPLLLLFLVSTSVFLSVIFLLNNRAASEKEVRQFVPAKDGIPKIERYDIRVSGSDSFYSIMRLFDLSPAEIHRITRQTRPVYNLASLRKGSMLSVYTLDGSVDRIVMRLGDFENLVLKKDGERYRAAKQKLPVERRPSVVSGQIEATLYEAGLKAGAPPAVILALSDIFAWDVDFATDVRKGDRFSILYENLYVEGRPVAPGRILGARIVNAGRTYTAFYYKDRRGRAGYFDMKGRSLRRMLLKSPLRYRRITSYFTNRRYHPILKRYRPHHGIDYAAPRGTPVDAAGSGRVEFAGWKRGYGRFIIIRHSRGFKTAYGHLSRIRRGIRRGTRVEQGEVIGYVGSTGLSTGPHLHYEVRKNGRLINPLNIRSNPARRVPRKEMAHFASLRDDILASFTTEPPVMTAKK